MTLTFAAVPPAEALDELARAITIAKGPDRLAPVTVIVPTNTCGVMARRALGRRTGLVGVDMVTLGRLAELIAGPGLAAAGRAPMSSSVIDLAIGTVLQQQPGSFRSVAGHSSTIVALRQLHDELRRAGPDVLDRLAQTSQRGREAVRVSRATSEALALRWYDEGDLFAEATANVRGEGFSAPAASVVVHLPQALSGLAATFVRAVAERIDVHVITTRTGDPALDVDVIALIRELEIANAELDLEDSEAHVRPVHVRPVHVVSTTDADDEVRLATRAVLEAARSGTPFERIAIVWPTQRPYARLVEHHLTAADIPWNGRPGTAVTERLAPRLVLDLLDVDRRGLRRRGMFALLADVPPRAADGSHLPTASWERVSREAGVARDDDWGVRLGALSTSERWGEAATSLNVFVADLRAALGPPTRIRPWREWADWCVEQLDRWVGQARLAHLPEIEFRAWESLTRAIDRLRHLDPVGGPVTRYRFRSALEAELDEMPGRVGRVGDGVTVGSLAGATGLDVDMAVVLGAAEGSLPPRPSADPLISETDRTTAGLSRADSRTIRLHHVLVALTATSDVTFTVPRGDLRSTAHSEPSRWLSRWATASTRRTVDSSTAGLVETDFPCSPVEYRLRSRYSHVRSGAPLGSAPHIAHDRVVVRGLALLDGRASNGLSVYDGDLSGVDVPLVDGVVSPTQLESWSSCPHGYFMRYLLRVVPIDEPDDEISITALDRGTTHHEALDRFHRAVIAGELDQPHEHGWTNTHRVALMHYFDDECARAQRRGRTGRRAYWSDEQERMRADLLGWLDHDGAVSQLRGSTVIASEHRFGDDGTPGATGDVGMYIGHERTIRLRGSVDRIDRTASGDIVVTDHKSGSATKYRKLGPDDPTLGGRVFQLPAYAAAARALLDEPDTEVIAEYGMMGAGGYRRLGYTLSAGVEATVAIELSHVIDGIESGYFPNRPERPGWRLFVPCQYCEPDHLGTADRWREWTRKRNDARLAPWFGPAVDPSTLNDEGDGP